MTGRSSVRPPGFLTFRSLTTRASQTIAGFLDLCLGWISNRTHSPSSRLNRSMLKACRDELSAPVSTFTFISLTPN